jgi:hypothetical protein
MDHFCSNLFRNETAFADRQKSCVQWFEDALEHCSTSILAPRSLDQVSYWVYDTFAKVTHFIFANTFFDVEHLDKSFDAKKLSQRHCNTLFFESSKDYIELVPKYNEALTQIMWLKAGMCLLVAFMALNYTEGGFMKLKKQYVWMCNAFKRKNLYISPWNPQQAVVNSVVCHNIKSEPPINDLPKIIFKAPTTQMEWDNFLGFVSQDSEIGEAFSTDGSQNVEEIIQKIKNLFHTRTQCRIFIDFEMKSNNSDDSDRFSEDIPLLPTVKLAATELQPSHSAELIENITEPIEMLDGKISCLSIPVAYGQPIEVIEQELSNPKNISRTAVRATRGAHVWKPKLPGDRSKKPVNKNSLSYKKM